MVREYPEGSLRGDALWPMFWSGREGSCPFVRPRESKHPPKHAEPQAPLEQPKTNNKVLGENKQIVNRGRVFEQPASGIINSSNAFSAIRSTTTCGSKSHTSALSGLGGAIGHPTSLSRQVRDMKTRTVIEPVTKPVNTMRMGAMDPPPAKKRKVEATLREQFAKIKTKEKVEKKEGYCENCKDRFDDYQEVLFILLCWADE
jgi:hypothetical protein